MPRSWEGLLFDMDQKAFKHTAKQARLILNPEEEKLLRENISDILEKANCLEKYGDGAFEPLWSTAEKNTALFEKADENRQLNQKDALANAARKKDGFFVG